MTTKLYANLGKGATDGTVATTALLAGGGDNPLMIGGASGWAFESDDISPDGPPDGHGFRRNTTGSSSYLRSAFEPTGNRSGAAFWFYLSGAPAVNQNFMRLVDASEQAVLNLTRRTTGTVSLSIGIGAYVQTSPVLGVGWYRFEMLGDFTAQRAWYRVLDATGAEVHSYDSGAGEAALGSAVAGVRFGEPASGAHGITTIRLGSRIVWGSLDSGWFPRNVEPFSDTPEPPPATSAVSHYNTAEGLTVGDNANAGVGSGPDGIKLSARQGTTGASVTVTDAAINGTRAYLVHGGAGGQAYVQWGVNSRSLAARMHLKAPSAPTETTRVLLLRNAYDEPVANLLLTGNSEILLQGGRGTVVSRTLPGVPDYSRALRLELWADVDANVVHAAWGYEDSGNEGEDSVACDLGNIQLSLAQYGKLLSSSWAADFVIDDLAANVRATGFIGGYAATYTMLPTVGADIGSLEPGAPFELQAVTGTATWAQVVGAGHPVVPLSGSGSTVTGIAPYTLDGVDLVFTYGDAELNVGVLRATERYVGAGGVESPLEVRVGL